MNRRLFLTGAAGVCVGLPFLESLRPRSAWGAQPAVSTRFIAWFNCNGVDMTRWFPNGDYGQLTGSMLNGTALEPLAPFAGKMLIPRGIHMTPKGWGWDPSNGDDHAKGIGHKLTARPLSYDTGYATGISVDQHIANFLHPGQPALNLSVGAWYDGVNGHISYTGDSQPVTGENDPWLAYQDLFDVSPDPGSEAQDRLLKRRQSVLDLVGPEYEALLANKVLSSDDRNKLDMHFSAIRDLEIGTDGGVIECAMDSGRAAQMSMLDPNTVAYDSQYPNVGPMQMDILALAIACGKTRSATLQWASGAGGPIFTWDGMQDEYNHHKLSHGNTKDDNSGDAVPGYLDMLFAIDLWHARQLAYLAAALDGYSEGDGTVLDHCMLLYNNDLSDGLAHSFMDLPYLVMGSANGYFKQGQYTLVTNVGYTSNDKDAPHNKLLTMACNAMGMSENHFGDPGYGSDGEFDELKA